MINLNTYLGIIFFATIALGLFSNVGIGYAQNTLYGTGAGANITTGNKNVMVGYQAGLNSTTGYANLFIGHQAGRTNTTGGVNVFNGFQAGYKNTTGYANLFSGTSAGYSNTTGYANVFNGYAAGRDNTTGFHNVFNGSGAGYKNTSGKYNVFNGYYAGFNNSTGNYNVFIGRQAGINSNTSNGVFLGHQAGNGETSNARLHIANHTINSTSLIYGEFDDAQVGINTTYVPNGYTLAVKGKVITEEVKVRLYANWPDYVFKADYELPSLETVENHIATQGHLPGIPSAQEVAEEGFELGAMSAKLLEKVEELTLYVIDLKKENKTLKEKNTQLEELSKQLNELSTESKQLKERLELLENE